MDEFRKYLPLTRQSGPFVFTLRNVLTLSVSLSKSQFVVHWLDKNCISRAPSAFFFVQLLLVSAHLPWVPVPGQTD